MFVEVVGGRRLPDGVDRDDVEDLLVDALGADGEVTGAGTGSTGWHLDVEIDIDAARLPQVLQRLAAALVTQNLGWVTLRSEHEPTGKAARDLI